MNGPPPLGDRANGDVRVIDLVNEAAQQATPTVEGGLRWVDGPAEGRSHLERQTGTLAQAARHTNLGEGRWAASPAREAAARLGRKADEADLSILASARRAHDERARLLQEDEEILRSHGHKRPDKRLQAPINVLLGTAEAVGMPAALYGYGDSLVTSVPVGVGMGAASVALGKAIGSNVRRRVDRAARSGAPPEPRHAGLFAGPPGVEVAGRRATTTFLLGAGVLAAGVATVRAMAEGSIGMGLAFGCVSFGVTLGSAAVGYLFTDDVGDYLEARGTELDRAKARLDTLSDEVGQRDAARTAAEEITLVSEQQAAAAEATVYAWMDGSIRTSPEIFGHGFAAPAAPPRPTNGHANGHAGAHANGDLRRELEDLR